MRSLFPVFYQHPLAMRPERLDATAVVVEGEFERVGRLVWRRGTARPDEDRVWVALARRSDDARWQIGVRLGPDGLAVDRHRILGLTTGLEPLDDYECEPSTWKVEPVLPRMETMAGALTSTHTEADVSSA